MSNENPREDRSMRRTYLAALLLGSLVLAGACSDTDFVIPDLNNPGLESLEQNPTDAALIDAAQGLMIGARAGHTGQISTTSHMGILGRESLVFDNSDPRYIDEILAGSLNAGNGAFGGFGWAPRYANLRNASIVVNATDVLVSDVIGAEEKDAIRGFTHTVMALDLYWVAMLRWTNGGVIAFNRPFSEGPAPLVSLPEVLDEIERLLDQADSELAGASETFPFQISSGFDGFDTPETFRMFNRALKARVNVLRGDYASALTDLQATWVGQGVPLDMGVYHVFSTNAGDATNGLFQGASPQIVAHPSLRNRVQQQGDGSPDDRFQRKTETLEDELVDPRGVSSDLRFTHYPSLASPLPIIRNEELLLLRAEARWFTGDVVGAMSDLNYVRTTSGGLDAILVPPTTDAGFIDMLTYERLFSLLFEGGHHWIDARRFDFFDELPRDRTTDDVPLAFPIPRNECIARGQQTCSAGS